MIYGGIFGRSYPWAKKSTFRHQNVMDCANRDLKQHSKVLRIQKSKKHGFGMFAKRAIKEGEVILKVPTPFGISYEQLDTDERTATQCYNCFQKLEDSSGFIFPCCPHLKFCSSDCKEIANTHYHKAICGKDFSDVYNHAQNTWGGKAQGGKKSEMGIAGFYNDKQSRSYPKNTNWIYPSHVPLILLRFLAICIQSGGHPLKHPIIEQLVPHQTDDVQWNEGKIVVIP